MVTYTLMVKLMVKMAYIIGIDHCRIRAPDIFYMVIDHINLGRLFYICWVQS